MEVSRADGSGGAEALPRGNWGFGGSSSDAFSWELGLSSPKEIGLKSSDDSARSTDGMEPDEISCRSRMGELSKRALRLGFFALPLPPDSSPLPMIKPNKEIER